MGLVIAAVIVAAAIVTAVLLLGNRKSGSSIQAAAESWQDLMDIYMEAVFEGDGEAVMELVPDELLEEIYDVSDDGDGYGEMAQRLEDYFAETVDVMTANAGEDWSYAWSIMGDDNISWEDHTEDDFGRLLKELKVEGLKKITIYFEIHTSTDQKSAAGLIHLLVIGTEDGWSLASVADVGNAESDWDLLDWNLCYLNYLNY